MKRQPPRIRLLRLVPALLVLLALAPTVPAQERQDAAAAPWYRAEAVNRGLGPAPPDIDRATPRSAVASFVDAADRGDFAGAAHVLNLEPLPPARQGERGPELARQLAMVIERTFWIDWSRLSGRPDAMIEDRGGNHPLAGRPRRDIPLQLLEAEGRAYEIRLARYKPEEGDPVWLFTPQTVGHLPVLYESFGPQWFERRIPDGLDDERLGLRLWEWVALPVLVGLILFVVWATNRLAKALAARVKRPAVRRAVANTGMPLALMTSAGALELLLSRMVSFSGPLSTILAPLLIVLAVVGLSLAALRLIDGLLDHITSRYVGAIDDAKSADERRFYTMMFAVRRLILLVMVAIGASLVLLELNLFASVGVSLVASAGILTVILGIAGQAVLGNILASLQIAFAKPVRIGDSVIYEGNWAFVEAIYYTFIRLRTWDERRIVVPVKYFISHPFENWSVKNPRIMRTVTLVLDHSADPAVLRERFVAFAEADEAVIEHDRIRVYVLDHGERGQTVAFYAMAPDPSTGWVVEMRLRERMLDWIRTEHPEWWPRDRVAAPEGDGEAARRLPEA